MDPHRVRLTTSDGVGLEAELSVPDEPWAVAVLTHPHPRHGGDMRSLVTGALFDALPAAGVAALRFNFRGVGGSSGSHSGGRLERLDVVAAVDAAVGDDRLADLPLILAGWSFGADVALGVDDERVDGWFAAAPPLRVLAPEELVAGPDARPVVLAVPQHDEFCGPDAAREATAGWTDTRVEVVSGADHFLVGRTDRVAELCLDLLRRLSPADPR